MSRAGAPTTTTRLVPIDAIQVAERLRTFRPESVPDLAASIAAVGLINPITVSVGDDDTYRLVGGRHRLAACQQLGWTEVEANVLTVDNLDAELVEIDENLMRSGLNVLERGEHLVRRSEILKKQGRRAGHGRPKKGVTVTTLETTADLAARIQVSKSTAERSMRVARELPVEVRDAIRESLVANSLGALVDLAGQKDQTLQLEIARNMADNPGRSVHSARYFALAAMRACKTCERTVSNETLQRDGFVHCDACANHYAIGVEVCGACGSTEQSAGHAALAPAARRTLAPWSGPAAVPGSGLPGDPTLIPGQQMPAPFYSRDDAPAVGKLNLDAFPFATNDTAPGLVRIPTSDPPARPTGGARVELLKSAVENLLVVNATKLADASDPELRGIVRDALDKVRAWLATADEAVR